MRARTTALVALVLSASPALAEECVVEDWTHSYNTHMQALSIDGATTCKTGAIRLRLYDGEGEARKLLGVETAYIEGYIFEAVLLQVARPVALSMKYSIEAE